jgi:hypothetical protein
MFRRGYRHRHDWEVVEKTLLEGLSPDEATRAAKAANGQIDYDKIVEATRSKMIVHYRCMCGAEKVERI